MRQKRVIAAVIATLLVVGATGFLFVQSSGPPPAPAIPAPSPQPARAAALSTAPVPVATANAPPAADPAASTTVARDRLQQRLDALAAAYEKGDWRAAERAMWPNHAVVRPNGEHLERAEIREAWQEEWEGLSNRDLKLYVEKYDVKGNVAAAQWTVLLTGDFADRGGDVHHMMIQGTQTATLVGEGDEQVLDGPIVYTAFERTLDGNTWPTD